MKSSSIIIVALVGLLVLLQYKLWFSPDGVAQFWALKKNIAEVTQDNQQQQQKNQQVAAEVHDLKDGTNAVEERARKDLGLIKPGEVYYQIIQ